jgi:hypothetical protein
MLRRSTRADVGVMVVMAVVFPPALLADLVSTTL